MKTMMMLFAMMLIALFTTQVVSAQTQTCTPAETEVQMSLAHTASHVAKEMCGNAGDYNELIFKFMGTAPASFDRVFSAANPRWNLMPAGRYLVTRLSDQDSKSGQCFAPPAAAPCQCSCVAPAQSAQPAQPEQTSATQIQTAQPSPVATSTKRGHNLAPAVEHWSVRGQLPDFDKIIANEQRLMVKAERDYTFIAIWTIGIVTGIFIFFQFALEPLSKLVISIQPRYFPSHGYPGPEVINVYKRCRPLRGWVA